MILNNKTLNHQRQPDLLRNLNPSGKVMRPLRLAAGNLAAQSLAQ
jgi:hypothetical protein